MRVEEIGVDGFGLIADRILRPGEGLTVVRGQNEAGKTTLLAFVRAILFGFDAKRYPAAAGGRRGGHLAVRTTDGRAYRIERHGERGGAGTLRVLDDAGVDRGADELGRLLQGVDATLFRNVFAFGLAELSEFERLTSREVVARIYGAGLGLGSVSAVAVEERFRAEAGRLFAPRASTPAINTILRKLDEVDARIRDRNLPAEHDERTRQLRDSVARRAAVAGRMAATTDAARRHERHRKAWPAWIELREAEAERAALGEAVVLPPDLPERLAQLETRRDQAAERREATELDARLLAEALARIIPNENVLEHRDELGALAREAIRDGQRRMERDAAVREVDGAARELDEALARLGPGWSADRIDAFDDSLAVTSAITSRFRPLLDGAAGALAAATRARTEAERSLTALETEAEALENAITDAGEEAGGIPPAADLERRLRGLESGTAARDRAIADAARAGTEAEAAEAAVPAPPRGLTWAEAARDGRRLAGSIARADAVAAMATGRVRGAAPQGPSPLAPVLLAVGALAVALVVALAGLPPLLAVLVAVVGLGIAGWLWFRGRREEGTPTEPPADAASDLVVGQDRDRAVLAVRLGLPASVDAAGVEALLARADEASRSEAAATSLRAVAESAATAAATATDAAGVAAEAAGLRADAAPEDVVRLGGELEEARGREARRGGLVAQLASLRRGIEGRTRDLASAGAREDEAARADLVARGEWRAWLAGRGLDEDLDRETADRLVQTITAAKKPLRLGRQVGRHAAELEEAHAGFVAAAVRMAGDVGRPVAGVSADDDDHAAFDRLMADLAADLAAAVDGDARRSEARRTSERLAAEAARAAAAYEAADAELTALAAVNGAADAASLRAGIATGEHARALDGRIAASVRALETLSGPGQACERLRAELEAVADVTEIAAAEAELSPELERLDGDRRELDERIGELRDAIARMEADAMGAEDRQAREDLTAQLEADAAAWATYTLARGILARAREAYEAAHRPAVIETAEAHFAAWTDGRYRRILAPAGSQVEAVEQRDGTRVALEDLSTGTAQQLYLAIRLGLLEHFAQSAEPLPIVMDDILVNFDEERAARAARSIEELASRQQVLYFTCHQDTPLRGATVVELPRLGAGPDAATA